MTTLRARYDGRVLIPEGSVDLPAGSVLELQVLNSSIAPISGPHSVARLREAMRSAPRLNANDVDAFEDATEQGTLPVDGGLTVDWTK